LNVQRPSTLLLSSCGGAAGITAVSLLAPLRSHVRIIGCDASNFSYAQEVVDFFRVVPPIASLEYPPAVLSLIDEFAIDAWIPLHSSELTVAANLSEELEDRNVAWPQIPVEVACVLSDKLSTYRLLSAANILVAPFVGKGDDQRVMDEWTKCVLKPRTGAGSRGVRVLAGSDICNEPLPTDYIAQLYVDGVEMSLDGLVLESGRILGPIARRRLDVRNGLAVVSESAEPNSAFDKLFGEVANVTRVIGPLNIQIIVNGGGNWLIDVNPRLPAGGMALTAAQGLNMPTLVVEWLLYGANRIPEIERSRIHMRHYRFLADAIVELRG
jgi:carbamoyl-phosphate synthase large subunit